MPTPYQIQSVQQLTGLPLHVKRSLMISNRGWRHSRVLLRGEFVQAGLAMLAAKMKDSDGRGVLFIPDGTYALTEELNLRHYPRIDLLGESRQGTRIVYDGPSGSAVYTEAADTLIGCMTIQRRGAFSEPTGYGSRYAIHNNTPAAEHRTTILFDLDLKTTAEVGSNGVGSTVGFGDTLLCVNVNCDWGFFASNGDQRRLEWEQRIPPDKQPASSWTILLDCTAGLNPDAGIPGSAIRYWNIGSGSRDNLVVCGGRYHGQQFGLDVINFGPPYAGESETEVFLGNATLEGIEPVRLPPHTHVERI